MDRGPSSTTRPMDQAENLVTDFAARTGLTSNRTRPVRYLWTDAFAVCNLLALARAGKSEPYALLARRLVDQVHETLGRHRDDDSRSGWLSGLNETEGSHHPTAGGLRIGKNLPERSPYEPFDEQLEWERDGQYFHYLSKWMHALDLMARQNKEPHYAEWAIELAEVAGSAFIRRWGDTPRMVWKMSIDLSRPLISSMGHHDPLDGYITLRQLQATAKAMGQNGMRHSRGEDSTLNRLLETFREMIRERRWQTADPLGLGGLLSDAARLMQLIRKDDAADIALLKDMLRDAHAGLDLWAQSGTTARPAHSRLAFRELGLAIGLQGLRWMQKRAGADSELESRLNTMKDSLPIAQTLTSFWAAPASQQSPAWTQLQDINAVMLATALMPQGFLMLPAPNR